MEIEAIGSRANESDGDFMYLPVGENSRDESRARSPALAGNEESIKA